MFIYHKVYIFYIVYIYIILYYCLKLINMYHRSDSCIQLGVMNLVSTFEQHDGFGMFRSPHWEPRISLMSYKMLVLHHLISCKLHLTSDDMFFLWWKKSASIPKSSTIDCPPATIGAFTHDSVHGATWTSPRLHPTEVGQQHFHKIRHAQGIQNSSRLGPKHSEINNWLVVDLPSEKSWSSSVGVIIPNIWVCLKIVYP